ncbi:uncharacterized protein METZ01_LOCUS170543 [marine metagenome]|uniref:Uncharacterized protein n=1 Tax=marine metagenome TaxID=408172 RepID=A0A382BVQ3_9ZZZZ
MVRVSPKLPQEKDACGHDRLRNTVFCGVGSRFERFFS